MANKYSIRNRKQYFFYFFTIIGLFLFILTSSSSSAHPEGPAHHNILPTHATNVMRAFWTNHHEVQNLAAMVETSCAGGFAGVYPCDNVDLMAFMPLADIGGTSNNSAANDIWGWTDPQTGKEYALVGRVFGTSFVDISDPANPIYLGELPTHGAFGSSWRDIKTYNNHAFIVSEASQHGMQVFDLTQLRDVSNPPVTFSETKHYKKNASAHNIVINEDSGYAYIVGAAGKNSCNGGLHIVNIQNPASPTFAGCFSSDGYTHDAQCVIYTGPDTTHQGKEICFNSNEDTVTIVDVSNKNNPVQLSRTGYSGAQYTHQGWLTEDQATFLLDDELDEQRNGNNTRTRVWDVSDLDNPVLTGFFDNSTPAIDHNQYVKGNFAYQANYRSGLRVLDISDVANTNLSQVAFFDIYPANDDAQFNGAWSNYPYFDSGTVIVSGIEQGLFILHPNLQTGPTDNPPAVTITDPADGAIVGGTISFNGSATDDNGVNQVEFFVDGNSVGVDTTVPYSSSWDSTTVADGLYVVSAIATDTIGQAGNDSISITVDNVPDTTLHVGDLDALTSAGRGGKWNATITITVHDSGESALVGATVSGLWSAGASGSGSCVTNSAGQCSITKNNISRNSGQATFTVTGIAHSTNVFAPGDSHDPDGDSNGANIVVTKPQ